ncbi:MAG: hypothetical protein E6H85_00925 [Chloroflexi bacterium]|nr:MAG: hypothetical protein E6H85_00925 [Chloroflexota bacterium]
MEIIVGRPAQGIDQRRPVSRRVPLHQDQLHRQPEPNRLLLQPLDEELHPRQQVATVLVVARGRDHAELGLHALRLALSSPVLRHSAQ